MNINYLKPNPPGQEKKPMLSSGGEKKKIHKQFCEGTLYNFIKLGEKF